MAQKEQRKVGDLLIAGSEKVRLKELQQLEHELLAPRVPLE